MKTVEVTLPTESLACLFKIYRNLHIIMIFVCMHACMRVCVCACVCARVCLCPPTEKKHSLNDCDETNIPITS